MCPTLSTRRCIASPDEYYSVSCSCNKCNSCSREWREWQELYPTTPRCGCQYRIISQERLAEAKEHPDRFNNARFLVYARFLS